MLSLFSCNPREDVGASWRASRYSFPRRRACPAPRTQGIEDVHALMRNVVHAFKEDVHPLMHGAVHEEGDDDVDEAEGDVDGEEEYVDE